MSPESLRVDDRVDLSFLPPFFLIPHGMERAVVGGTERPGPLVAHLATHRAKLGKSDVMGMPW